RAVGRIRDELETLGLAENTVIIYTSDHGCHFCTRNAEYKRSCHESSIRVPLIATGPGFTSGDTVEEMVSLIDLPPTLLAAAGAQVPDTFQGRPVQPLVADSADDWPEEAFVQISEAECGRAIRTPRWKYGVTADPDDCFEYWAGSDIYSETYLYDLDADPHERKNLVDDPDHATTREQLRERLIARMTAAGEDAPTITPVSSSS
ncbi:MAG: sulfatase-like hydrolase/transferase, partial [Phycisphaeraceae bacterium]|nr:sulfatase-like hydrolase/transferase [Phycisphaeraceae bacterium]